MNYWLMKTEPSTFGIDHLAKKPKKTAMWDGVRNYHAGNMQVVRTAYPDPTQFDKKSDHYDAGAKREDPRWFVVDVQLKKRFKRVITLDELRKHESDALDGMLLLKRGNR